MKYLSLCSGVEAATVAWHPLGWKPIAFAEIEKFPSQVLAHHYPNVPNMGDMTKFKEWDIERPDLIVGGTPCQSFSVAGLRKGLSDPRGNLALTFLAMVDHHPPEWVVWENVPGVLSSNGGRDFGSFLGGLAELGYGFAYRVLDAQYFGVAQRRRRVFVIANARDWRRASAVLFERESLSGNPAPRRESGERAAPTISARPSGGGGLGTDFDLDGGLIQNTVSTLDASFGRLQGASGQDANHGHSHLVAFGGNNTAGPIDVATACNDCASASGRMDFESETFIATGFAQNQRDELRMMDVAGALAAEPGMKQQTFIAFGCKDSDPSAALGEDISPTLRAMGHTGSHANAGGQVAVAFGWKNSAQQGDSCSEHVTPTLDNSKTPAVALAIRGREGVPQIEVGEDVANAILTPNGGRGGIGVGAMMQGMAVRRLTPRECERLQDFPDDYTLIPVGNRMAADGPRYKAMGNSMCVGVMRWLGERIAEVDSQ